MLEDTGLDIASHINVRVAGLLVCSIFLLILGCYWDWPGSRRKDMPPGILHK